ncbi:biotin--[acetyl-CoA-carboxylase] ligase [Neomicrococcus aestuarii]|uniref:biotin--[biotin carboxyl-carrier protein] ligase n=1 Tax=Neomicrococcus aestuarii TaxID=556325 RepID=A0A1L2ZM09_9MICC|nr:biotin--[acetyl-CoA-carboxylase] ligase [Neomicrococcus aestuarii]APF40433.1 biotin--[acetyl-CoA-carboxylase] ligase [Neomicrococcus aestuarii]
MMLDSCPSTNAYIGEQFRAHPEQWNTLDWVATADQTAGTGRLGREWVAPRGTSLALSVFFRVDQPGEIPSSEATWLSVLCALALTRTLEELGADERAARLKWPNDVLVNGKKIAGILAQFHSVLRPLHPGASAGAERETSSGVVVGIGTNISMTQEQLPVRTATSLALEGIEASVDQVREAFLKNIREAFQTFKRGNYQPAAWLRDAVKNKLSSLNMDVRAELPNGRHVYGQCVDLDNQGALIIESADGQRHIISAGDIIHLRRSDGAYA